MTCADLSRISESEIATPVNNFLASRRFPPICLTTPIIGENAIFTFQQFNEARAEAPVERAIGYVIAARLRPKLMTALAAIAALLLLALGIGAGAQLHQPLAIAVIGGLLLALPLLLVVLPSLLRLAYSGKTEPATPA